MKKLLIIISILSGFSAYSIGPVRQNSNGRRNDRAVERGQQPLGRRIPELNQASAQDLRQSQIAAQALQERLSDLGLVDQNGNRILLQDILARAEVLGNQGNELLENEEESSENDQDSSLDEGAEQQEF